MGRGFRRRHPGAVAQPPQPALDAPKPASEQLNWTQDAANEVFADRLPWCLTGANVDLQFSCSDTGHRDHDRDRSQISFLSDTPKADLDQLASWFNARGLPTYVGAYSDREFYLDVPAAFVNFVVEAMLPELAAYDVVV